MTPSPHRPNPIRSREHLLHLLAEAAELEHNLLCSYLYAAFSLKQGLDEDLEPHELEAVGRWRGGIMKVCLEEMTHLAQVANLMVAVGSRPHFDRPNLPVAPGYHPARIQVALTPFDLETLDHFIFLERPEASTLEDAASFRADDNYVRQPETGILMPSAPDYATIGEFYALLGDGLTALAAEMGEAALFIGPAGCQLQPAEIRSKTCSSWPPNPCRPRRSRASWRPSRSCSPNCRSPGRSGSPTWPGAGCRASANTC